MTLSPELLRLTNIRREFGSFVALHDLSLTLSVGCIGLLGPNGAGKSTLLKIIMGLVSPTRGSGTVLGQPLGGERDSANLWQLRRLVGFMPEADALVPGLTGVEYVCLAGELCGMPRRQALRRGHEVLSYLQLEEARYRQVEEYSAGMKQRVKLAQALIHDPPLLLLDEPTSGLDPAGRDAMLKLIAELSRDHGKSVILSTHLLADVQTVCEQVVILAGGRVCNVGTVEQLCAVRRNRFRLRVQGDAQNFLADLQHGGVQILSDNGHGEWRVIVPADWANLLFFQLADQNHVVIRALLHDDETLEELFLRTINRAA
jgi:ABC-2 type transport system ATP-binding protein